MCLLPCLALQEKAIPEIENVCKCFPFPGNEQEEDRGVPGGTSQKVWR
jgi:hypothetical protein